MSVNEIVEDQTEFDSLANIIFNIRHNAPKRAFDILFSFLFLVIGLPFFIFIALCIKIFSPGPVFYLAQRVGRGGKTFACWKFRTMCVDAEKKLKDLLQDNPSFLEEWKKHVKLKDDPRVTFIGKILRRTSIDELPQFWNVLKGDLSVVGPRPVTMDEIKKFGSERTKKILSVRPGLTGIWQTSGRSLLTFEERLKIEESYVDKQSFLFDLRLVCKTVPIVFFSKGAF